LDELAARRGFFLITARISSKLSSSSMSCGPSSSEESIAMGSDIGRLASMEGPTRGGLRLPSGLPVIALLLPTFSVRGAWRVCLLCVLKGAACGPMD
jgi:hypothetical protein